MVSFVIFLISAFAWFLYGLLTSEQESGGHSPLEERIAANKRQLEKALRQAEQQSQQETDFIDKVDINPKGTPPNLAAMREEKVFFSEEEIQTHGLTDLQPILNGLIVQTHTVEAVLRKAREKRDVLATLLGRDKVNFLFTDETPSQDSICSAFAPLFDLIALDLLILKYYERGRIIVPERIKFADMAIRMDGGSKTFIFQEVGTNDRLEITLIHYNYKQVFRNPQNLTGSLYYEGVLVPVRSELERVLLERITQCINEYSKNARWKERATIAVKFVESNDYLEIAKILGRIPAWVQ